jgi:hypothetical protein
VKAKTTIFFGFATETMEIPNFFGNCQWNSSLLCDNIFFVKALRQWRQIWEAMKQWNVKYGKKLKQWSDEAFNAGKEIEAMKRLTLHCIASSLHRSWCPALLPSAMQEGMSVDAQVRNLPAQTRNLVLENEGP